MSNGSGGSSSSGISFAGLLTVVFVALKIIKVITWSWLWVLSPIWISAGLTILFLAIALIIAIVTRN